MADIQEFLCDVFEEEIYSKDANEQKEFLSLFLNDDKNAVLYEQLLSWIDDTIDVIIPDAPENFKFVLRRSVDINEMRELLFNFIKDNFMEA